jgi:hypothetical protein
MHETAAQSAVDVITFGSGKVLQESQHAPFDLYLN